MSTYEEAARCCTTGRGSQLCIVDKKHDQLKSFGRFWYQEIRDFLNSKCTVPKKVHNFPQFRSDQMNSSRPSLLKGNDSVLVWSWLFIFVSGMVTYFWFGQWTLPEPNGLTTENCAVSELVKS
jgi:hypothetical protein